MVFIPAPPPMHHSSTPMDPKLGIAVYIAIHVLPIVMMAGSYIVARIRNEWDGYEVPMMFEFFGFWLLAIGIIDLILLFTYLIMLLL